VLGAAHLGRPADEADRAALLLTVAVMLPAVWLGVRAVEGRSLGWVSSVAGRLRWWWLALTVVPIAALVVLGSVAFIVVGSLVEPDSGGAGSEPVQWGSAVVCQGDRRAWRAGRGRARCPDRPRR